MMTDLAQRAQEVLDHNRRGDWTCPSAELYPHQWLWDSCFIAIGLARADPGRAAGEIRALFRGQWANGMLPNMIFAPGLRDWGSRRIWQSKRNPDAPRHVETSCITQPPLLAVAVHRVARALPAGDGRAFLAELFPRLVDYHRWLYRERDVHDRGLVTLIHPWECGLDTTPPWMRELRRMPAPWWLRFALRSRLTRFIRFFRTDTRFTPPQERPTAADGLRMLVLAHRIRRHDFDLRRLPPAESVLIEDLAFNALLAAANQSLEAIAGELGVAIEPELTVSFRKTETALEELWDEESGQYYPRNAVTGELIKLPTIATFLPLMAKVPPPDRTTRLLALLQNRDRYWTKFPVPSVPTDSRQFDDDRYWKGPTWINTNWAIIEGLRVIGEADLAEELRRRTLDLVEREGFSEYFSALNGVGFGADDFSWTAALTLDLLESSPR
ncbi:MAG TPA: trehalase family glycosidase [Acidimicrobiia bacterium]|nr:trehalase family glycosidase [Acidimicrobiia bacterium]